MAKEEKERYEREKKIIKKLKIKKNEGGGQENGRPSHRGERLENSFI